MPGTYALSIHQPEATLLTSGFHHLHVRTWTTGYRGPVWIHAASQLTAGDNKKLNTAIIRRHLDTNNLTVAYGAVIGKVTLTNVIPVSELRNISVSMTDWMMNEFEPDTYVFQFAAPKQIKPYYTTGGPNLFEFNPSFFCA